MNKDLLEKMRKFKKEIKAERSILVEQHAQAETIKEKNEIVGEIKKLDKLLSRVISSITNNDERELESIAEEFHIAYKKEEAPSSVSTKPYYKEETAEEKSKGWDKFLLGLGTGLGLVGAGLGIASCSYNKGHDMAILEEGLEEEKPFEVYGEFNDASNEKQAQNRAVWYYDTYVSQNQGINQIGLNDLMNVIRFTNGEFILDDNGRPVYNDANLDEVSNDIWTIANYNSFTQYGNQIRFIPYAPLFEDGSLAQQGAMMFDNAMEKVVEAIRTGNQEAFLQAATEWGRVAVNVFDQIDFTGEYPNFRQMEISQAQQLFQVMYSTYTTSIFEYGQKYNLNVCIPYCVNYSTHEMQNVPLSQIMYDLAQTPRDWVAKRSGNEAEFAENNCSVAKQLYNENLRYFQSKYSQELGNGRVLR